MRTMGVALLVMAAFPACGDDEYTSTVVTIDAEEGVRERAAFLAIRVLREDDTEALPREVIPIQGESANAALPFRLELVLGESPNWRVEAELLGIANNTFRRESLSGTHVPGQVSDAELIFEDRPTQIALGSLFSCVLRDDELFCFGADDFGAIGGDCPDDRCREATRIEGAFQHVTAYGSGICALSPENILFCWGDTELDLPVTNEPTAVPDVARYRQVAFSQAVRCGVTLDGALECASEDPLRRPGPADQGPLSNPIPGVEVQRVDVGRSHVCALDTAGFVHCWGTGNIGTLGRGVGDESTEPRPSETAGYSHLSIGNPFGGGTICPDQSSSTTSNTCAIRDGQLYCWGFNGDGMLAEASAVGECAFTPTLASSESGWEDVALGAGHGCGIREGLVYCWGANDRGQLGRELDNDGVLPVGLADTPPGITFSSVDCGVSHSCAVALDGSVYCWGLGREGQLGISSQFVEAPMRVPLPAQ